MSFESLNIIIKNFRYINVQILSNFSVGKGCLPYPSENNHLTQSELFKHLTDPCR